MMAGMLRAILAFFMAAVAIPSLALADGAATRPVKLAIVPFDVIGEAGHEWMGHALQEGLATGLQKSSGISAIIVAGVVPVDANAAIVEGRSVDADVVIFGSVQVNDQARQVIRVVNNHQTHKYESKFTPVTTDTFRLTINSSANPAYPNAAQISEIELYSQ